MSISKEEDVTAFADKIGTAAAAVTAANGPFPDQLRGAHVHSGGGGGVGRGLRRHSGVVLRRLARSSRRRRTARCACVVRHAEADPIII